MSHDLSMTPLDAAVRALVHARRTGRAVALPEPPLPDAQTAYAVQDAVAAALGWGAPPAAAAWKSGGPSRQATPTHAALPPAGVFASPADATTLTLHGPGVEAEVALRLARAVDAAQAAALDVDAARGLVDAMAVSIEIVDSRWQAGPRAPALERLADLQSHGALALGEWRAFDAARDWSRQACDVRIGGRPPERFVGTHPMGDPCWVLPAWLRHVTRHGGVAPAGTVVTTGTWCGLLPAAGGDLVEVRFDGLGEARIRL